jgi:3-oxoacyl-[acyl-carrier-protein] synthase II
MVTPLGLDVKESWQAILAGKSGAAPIKAFDASGYGTHFAAEVKGFNAESYFAVKDARKMDLFIQYGLAAAIQAVDDAALNVTEENASRIGVAIGSGIGGMPMIENTHVILQESGPRKVSPFFVTASIINMVSGQLSIRYGFKGPNIAIVTACTTGTHNIGQAMRMIAYGDADVMVAGGTEMATCPLGLAGFNSCRALSTRNDAPEKASRPWDKDRDGFVLGEGAGAIVLESYEHAKKRGATIYAELTGFGMSADAYHITSPDQEGAGFVSAMQNALRDSKVSPEAIQYINAHATSTRAGDELEALAVKKAFGDHSKQLVVSSTKSMTGHLLGAAGAVEAIFTILAIRDQVAPPTINLDNPAEGCDLNFVAHRAQERPVRISLSNSFGFGGTNGSLIFRRVED